MTRVHKERWQFWEDKEETTLWFLWIFIKFWSSIKKFWAKWMSILLWNTNSYESRTLHVMNVECKPNSGSLVILFLCIYFNTILLLEKEGTPIDHLLYAMHLHTSFPLSITTHPWSGFMLLIFRWGTWGSGRRLPAQQGSRLGRRGGTGALHLLEVHGFILTPPNKITVGLSYMLGS